MKNIIVFGNVPLATWVVKEIQTSKNLNLVGVVCNEFEEDAFQHHGMEEESLYSYCLKNDLTILGFIQAQELAKKENILGISIRYHKLFKEEYYNSFRPGIINLHGGELPRYRGANIANYAILENAKRGAGTLHFIAKGIDEGDIVEREFFATEINETAYSFFKKTLSALQVAFKIFIDKINSPEDVEIKRIPQDKFIAKGEIAKTYYKKGIENYRNISFENLGEWNDIKRVVRAFDFPGHRGAFLLKGNEKIELKNPHD